jgi:hypothetical protein
MEADNKAILVRRSGAVPYTGLATAAGASPKSYSVRCWFKSTVPFESHSVHTVLGRGNGRAFAKDTRDCIGVGGTFKETPMDPSGIDYRDYKKRYGHRVTFFGNIDITCPLATRTPAEVEKEVIEHMEGMKPGGRWVAGSAHSIVNYIPHENFVAMINVFHKYGLYQYRGNHAARLFSILGVNAS